MTDLRHEWDQRIQDPEEIKKIARDLGLGSSGKHFYCPGCRTESPRRADLVIQDGGFQCFRCGAQGDVVGLVKLARSCSLEEAVAWLERETEPPGGD